MVVGLGPLPVVGSINLFLWFKDDWYLTSHGLYASPLSPFFGGREMAEIRTASIHGDCAGLLPPGVRYSALRYFYGSRSLAGMRQRRFKTIFIGLAACSLDNPVTARQPLQLFPAFATAVFFNDSHSIRSGIIYHHHPSRHRPSIGYCTKVMVGSFPLWRYRANQTLTFTAFCKPSAQFSSPFLSHRRSISARLTFALPA